MHCTLVLLAWCSLMKASEVVDCCVQHCCPFTFALYTCGSYSSMHHTIIPNRSSIYIACVSLAHAFVVVVYTADCVHCQLHTLQLSLWTIIQLTS